MEEIISQMKNCVCEIHKGQNKGSGFFTKIRYKNELLYLLITNEHVLGKDYILKLKNITLSTNNNKVVKHIKINSNRKIYINETLDITIIEIKQQEDKIYDFLELDDKILNNENINDYNNFYGGKSIYVLNYRDDEIYSSFGLLNDIVNHKISHRCNTEPGASGSPIILLKNNKVIGVHHTGSHRNFKINYGTLLAKPISEFQKNPNNLIIVNENNNQIENTSNNNIKIDYPKININMSSSNSKFMNNINNNLINLDFYLNISLSIIKEREKILIDIIEGDRNNKNIKDKEYYLINKNYLKVIKDKFYLDKIFTLTKENQNKNNNELLNIVKTNLNDTIKTELNNINKDNIKQLLNSKEISELNQYYVNNDKSTNLIYYKNCDLISEKLLESLKKIDKDINNKCQKVECIFDKNIIKILINKYIINVASFEYEIFVKQIIISTGEYNSYNL